MFYKLGGQHKIRTFSCEKSHADFIFFADRAPDQAGDSAKMPKPYKIVVLLDVLFLYLIH